MIEKCTGLANTLRNIAIGICLVILIFKAISLYAGGHAGGFWPPDMIPHPMPENPIHHPEEKPEIN